MREQVSKSWRSTTVAPGAATRTAAVHQEVRVRRCLLVAALLGALGLAGTVHAQSITGGLNGSAPVRKGESVVVSNRAIGFSRDIAIGKNGRYALKLLAPGTYTVSLKVDGQTVQTRTVHVMANVSVAVAPFTLPNAQSQSASDNARTLGAVVVTANTFGTINPIDVTTPQLTTVYSTDLINTLTGALGIYGVPSLTSQSRQTSVSGAGGGSLPQVEGAGPTENRYYYNEFDTTYDVNGTGAIYFPQEAVSSVQFIPGNSSLEWTPTTGAILSSTLKQGTNKIHYGYSAYFLPPTSRLLNPRGHNSYQTINDKVEPYLYQSANRHGGSVQNYLWMSGPLVKDKLFFFALAGYAPPSKSLFETAQQAYHSMAHSSNGVVNLTWNITDSQSLDVAGWKSTARSYSNMYLLSELYKPDTQQGSPTWTSNTTKQHMVIGNYHWYISDSAQLRLMAAYMRQNFKNTNAYSDQPYAAKWDAATGVTTLLTKNAAFYMPDQEYYAKRGFKGDFTWHIGDRQTITLGAEDDWVYWHFQPHTDFGGVYTYLDYTAYPSIKGAPINDGSGALIPENLMYGTKYLYSSGGTFKSHYIGYYAFDKIQATRNLIVTVGERIDWFHNMDGTGHRYWSMTSTSPRIGLAWDVNGNGTFKIGANAGRYTLPMPSEISYIRASPVTNMTTDFSFTGINPDGTPQGYEAIGVPRVVSDGGTPQTSAVTSRGIRNTSQNEFQLYAQKAFASGWSALVEANYHILKDFVDGTCDNTGVISSYVRQHGHPNYGGLTGGCIVFNPGRNIVLRDYLDANGKLENITIPNSYLGMPKAKRKYYGLTFRLTHAYTAQELWYLSVAYTWGHLYGNTDGYVDLTKNSTPTPGYTGNYALKEFTEGSSGDLAGDVRNRLVATGVYFFSNPGLHIGGKFMANTGAAFSCLGTYPQRFDLPVTAYGRVSHYCENGKISPQGSAWRPSFSWQLDLSAGYDFTFLGGTLSLSFNITNVTNRSGITSRSMVFDRGVFNDTGTAMLQSPTYLKVNGFQRPRTTWFFIRFKR